MIHPYHYTTHFIYSVTLRIPPSFIMIYQSYHMAVFFKDSQRFQKIPYGNIYGHDFHWNFLSGIHAMVLEYHAISIYMWVIDRVHVGKYSSTMEHLGIGRNLNNNSFL